MSEETLISTFTELRTRFLKVAMRFLPSADDADDVLQDAFCRLWPRAEQIESRQTAEALTITTVRNLCIDEVRRRNRTEQVEFDAERDSRMTDSIEEELEREERFTVLKQIIESELSPIQQQIIRLRDFEEMEMDEIAEIVQMRPENVRVNLSRARKRIREVYKERGISHEE